MKNSAVILAIVAAGAAFLFLRHRAAGTWNGYAVSKPQLDMLQAQDAGLAGVPWSSSFPDSTGVPAPTTDWTFLPGTNASSGVMI